jgi:hypothetical protein
MRLDLASNGHLLEQTAGFALEFEKLVIAVCSWL